MRTSHTKKMGMVQNLRQEQLMRDPEAVLLGGWINERLAVTLL
jgi:hypothetical protein